MQRNRAARGVDESGFAAVNSYAPRVLLCGEDDYNGKNFDHRKSWLLARMKMLDIQKRAIVLVRESWRSHGTPT